MSTEEQKALKSLKYKRGVAKRTITKFYTYIQNENCCESQIKVFIASAERAWSQFHDTQSQIILIEEVEDGDSEVNAFEDKYLEAMSKAEQLISQLRKRESKIQDVPEQHSIVGQMRMPQIALPNFSGHFEEWMPFLQMFESLVDSNKTLSKVQKFHYLISGLKGDAYECIQDIAITSDNYDIAWDILKERYDNKKLIIKKHITGILDLPQLTHENANVLKQIVNGVQKHVRALQALGRPTEHWDDWLVCVIGNKLDRVSNKDWESRSKITHIPTYLELVEFLTHKLNTLESTRPTVVTKLNKITKPSLIHVVSEAKRCCICKGDHYIYYCQKFLKMTVEQRIKHVKSAKLCLNCLRSGHQASKCNSGHCRECNINHNTLLHVPQETHNENLIVSNTAISQEAESVVAHSTQHQKLVLLSTACIQVLDSEGKPQNCRALLDSGSQSHFITTSLASKLGLKFQSVNIPVCGISQAQTKINKSTSLVIKSNYNSFSTHIDCLVIENITNEIPLEWVNKHQLNIPKNITLADPNFHTPNRIDMLIGAQLFWHLLCVGQIRIHNAAIIIQKTQLGWVMAGSVEQKRSVQLKTICNVSIDQSLDETVRKFWELEEVNACQNYTPDEILCETHFVKTFKRNQDGRFIVQLPFKIDPSIVLGESKAVATRRFYSLERKLQRQSELATQYTNFINEYLELGHMKPINNESDIKESFYLPHHAVFKQDSLTTKLRVVFDASAKSQTGYSLNDILMVGPTVQQDLFSIICRFRTHKIVLTADITKMYRQVLVDEQQTRYQRIIWRSDSKEDLQIYELNTLTYGTASASFLATRALKQLALEEQHILPEGSRITLRDFYVDDLLTGANSVDEIERIFKEVNALLSKGGFELRKWACSDKNILRTILPEAASPVVLELDKNSSIKTLGVQWNSHSDMLQYNVPRHDNQKRISKRVILSQVAQIFDPLGLLGPVTVKAKLFIQSLWQLKISWDESLPTELHTAWRNYQANFTSLDSVTIQRNVLPYNDNIELHGFCDASERAYGACIYVRCSNHNGHVNASLLCSKSRVAPLKATTIPRLELSSALLLAQLTNKVKQILGVQLDNIYYWTDSTIALAWINTTSRQLKTFVANRVAEIQELTNISNWRHISSKENPADLLSRGIPPEQIAQCDFWWHGPQWLIYEQKYWPKSMFKIVDFEIPEMRSSEVISSVSTSAFELFEKYSSLQKLQRVVSYCLRFAHNALTRVRNKPIDVRVGPLTALELKFSLTRLAKIVQTESFSDERQSLKSKANVKMSSKLRTLNPFLDANDLIRIGGRIRSSTYLTYDQKHPIVLPSKHPFTRQLIEMTHKSELHAGIQATLAKIRHNFWPLSGRNTVRYVIRKCVTCFKANPIVYQPLMGDLPKVRVEPARPFVNVGVDYCGPFLIRNNRGRNASRVKTYIAIFICMAVKAVHIEVVSGLDTDSFINALKRFIARRGMISNIYSDNGTNFVGANKELEELRKLLISESSQSRISNFLTNEGINWHFSPARAPHFGGIWEAAVKSFKQHYKRIVGSASLTREEICTITVQIEAILNSRPLIPLSEDPSDLNVLTPGHFLIGDSLRANLEPNLTQININHLSRLQLLENLKQHFWKRWSSEYLQQLQKRNIWNKNSSANLQVGQLVIIKEDNTPPLLWPLGRISIVHPGKDNIVRAASVKTARGEVKRPANKLCILPLDI